MEANIDRRTVLLSTTAAMSGLAGCSGSSSSSSSSSATSSGPSLVVSNTQTVEARFVEQRAEVGEYFIMLENSGLAGSILLQLFFADGEEPAPSPAETTPTYLNSGERREISISASSPDWADRYMFEYVPLDFAAEVTKEGGQGDVVVKLKDGGEDGPVVREQTITMQEGEVRDVDFTTEEGINGEFYIRAEPA